MMFKEYAPSRTNGEASLAIAVIQQAITEMSDSEGELYRLKRWLNSSNGELWLGALTNNLEGLAGEVMKAARTRYEAKKARAERRAQRGNSNI